VQFGVNSGGAIKIWLNRKLVYRQHSRSGSHPKEIAYDRFRFERHFSARLQKGQNEWLVRYETPDAAAAVLFRPQTPEGLQDLSVRFIGEWSFAGAVLSDAVLSDAGSGLPASLNWKPAPASFLRELVIDSQAVYKREPYADWTYANGILLWSLLDLGTAAGEERLGQFVKKDVDFVLQHLDYFQKQYDSLHAFRGSYHRLSRMAMLDDGGAPALPLTAIYLRAPGKPAKQLIDRVANYISNQQPRLADGTFCRPEPVKYTVWADDLFMSVPLLIQLSKIYDDKKYLDDAARQVVNIQRYLRDPSNGLFRHGWFAATARQSPVCWGRANGWIAWGTAELLDELPASHKLYGKILSNFRQQMDDVVRYQAADGLWRQVLDNPASYEETSCTAMFTLAIARGVRKGWLPASYKIYAQKGWAGITRHITPDGVVHGICRGTDLGYDAAFYMNRATVDNDPRGLGAVISAGIEMAKMDALRGTDRQDLRGSELEESRNRLYDAGDDRWRPQEGYHKLTTGDHYTPEKGFGWLTPPVRAFDSTNLPLPQQFLKDGVAGTDSMVFREDLPNGDYFITLTLGGPPADTMSARIAINGEWLSDTITTPWHRLAYRTIRRRVCVKDKRVVIRIAALSAGGAVLSGVGSAAAPIAIGLYALSIRPAGPDQPITFTTPLQEDTAAVGRFAATLRQQLTGDSANVALANQLQNVEDYLLACSDYEGGGWSWAVKKTHMSLIYRLYAAIDLLEPLLADETDPLYDRAKYLLARTYYWLNQEDDDLYHGDRFVRYFGELTAKYPEDTLIHMYLGERTFIPPDFDTAAGDAPQWARLERETTNRLLKVVHWWVEKKQTADGEMGGKYGDDVELLRTWLPAILGADDSVARAGYLRLADGVWNSDALDKGFARRVDDVEHSAELFRDTHPALFLMNYGDPEYVERCLLSMRYFDDLWTGTTPLGHRHFRSYYLSSTKVMASPPYDFDVALNARAVLPGLWAAWYNHNPSILRSFSEWGRSWVADAARTDNGKPAGILPSAVEFGTDHIGGGEGEWYDAHLSYDYYRWDHLGHVGELHDQLLGMFAITGDSLFLQPVESYARLMRAAEKDIAKQKDSAVLKTGVPGSLDWVKYQLLTGGEDHDSGVNPMGRVFAMAGSITHSAVYDDLIAKFGEPYDRYRVTKDRREIEQGFGELLTSLSYNFPMLTSEVKFTDRVYIPGSNLLVGLCTGHFGAGYEYPSLVATWKNTGPDVAIFVHGGDRQSASVSLYDFGKGKKVSMRTWQLEPGLYVVRKGLDSNDDEKIDKWLSTDTLQLTERVNDIAIDLPSRKTILVSVRRLRSYGPVSVQLPDLAVNERDIFLSDRDHRGATVSCRVHNIGSRAASAVVVELLADDQLVDSTVIPVIDAPNDLVPRTAVVHFRWKPATGYHRLKIRVHCGQKEITRLNNAAEQSFPGSRWDASR
jgi:rhamnogalacturonyl hydrolase YesR